MARERDPAWCEARRQPTFVTVTLNIAGETNMLKPIRRLAKAIKGKTVEEREFAYLAEAYDLIDLEYRQRQIDRGLFGR
jgi:hypothetical protein